MFIRHGQFYFDSPNLHTEYGHEQTWLGMILIPVTSSFGVLFFFNRPKIKLNRLKILYLTLILVSVIIFNLIKGHSVSEILFYDKYIRYPGFRPSLIILVPILLSVFLFYYANNKALLLLALFFCSLMSYISNNFILHYLTIFVLFINVRHFALFRPEKVQFVILFFVLFATCVFYIYYFDIDRVPLIIEIVMIGCWVAIIYATSAFLIRHNLGVKYPIKILTFYIAQAIIFTLITRWTVDYLLGMTIVGLLSIFSLRLDAFTVFQRIASFGKR